MPAPLVIAIKLEGQNQVVSAVQQVSQQFTSFQQTLQAGFNLNLGAKLANSVLEAVGAFRRALHDGLQYAASLKDMSIQTGLTAEAVQVLGHSAAQSGASIGNVRTALTNLRQAATAAQAGNENLTDAFAQLGLDAKTITDLPLAAQLEAVARAFAASSGDGRSYAALIQVLGERDVPRLQGLLQDLARNGLGGMAAALSANGALLSSELIDKADEIGDRWGDLRVKLKTTFAELGIALKPLISLTQTLADLALSLLGMLTTAFQNLANGLGAFAAVFFGASSREAFDGFLALADRSGDGNLLGAPPPPASRPPPAEPPNAPARGGSSVAEMLAEQRRLTLALQPLHQQRAGAVEEVARAEQALARVIEDGNAKQLIDTEALANASLAVTAAKAAQAKIEAQINDEIDRQQQQSDAIAALEASFLPLEQQRVQARAALADAEQAIARLQADETSDANALLAAEMKRLKAKQDVAALEEKIARARAENENQAALEASDAAARQLAARRATLDGDFTRTEQEKFSERRRLLQEEIANQRTLLELLQARRDAAFAAGDTTGAAVFDQSSRQVGAGLDTLRNQQAGPGPDPNSFVQQAENALARLREAWGTTAQQIGQTIAGTIGTAVDSVSSAISGLILKTTTWRDALINVASAIVTQLVQSIVQLGVRWVANQILTATVGKAVLAASVAATAPLAALQAQIWAVPATLSVIATAGGTAAAAPLEIALATAGVKAQALAGFSEGGLVNGPGSGTSDSIAARLSNGEFVATASAVDRFGPDFFASLNAGILDLAALPGSVAAQLPRAVSAAPRATPAPAAALDMEALAQRIIIIQVAGRQEATRIARHSAARADIVRIVEEDFGLPRKT